MGLKKKLLRLKWVVFENLFRLFKINSNKIVVDNFLGRGYGGNPRAIVEELLKINDKLDVVWITDNNIVDKKEFPQNIRCVKLNSIREIYDCTTSSIWIDNIKINYKGKKRKGQFYLQTWHAGVGFKKVEHEAMDSLDSGYVKESMRDSSLIDLMISNSDWVTKNYSDNFWYDGKIAKTGLPRNDIFFKDNKESKQKVESYFNSNKKIILYAPTFRNYLNISEQINLFSLNAQKLVEAAEKRFGGQYILVTRVHPNIAGEFKITESDYLKDGSKYPDMQELLVSSDILITDFSSSLFDFMLKSSRIFLFASDYDNYKKYERELKFDPKKDLPFPFANSEEELISKVATFDEDDMVVKNNNLKDSLGICDDGHSAERVAKLLAQVIDGVGL